jgi:hypothetical protein
LAEGIDSPTKSTFHDPHLQTSPITPTVTRTRQSLGGRGTASSPRPASPRSPRTPQSGAATPQRVPSSSVPQVTSKMAYNVTADSEDLHETSTTTNTTSKFALGRYPMVVEVLDITGTERGAFEAGRVRIVTSRRLSSRAGAERRVSVFERNSTLIHIGSCGHRTSLARWKQGQHGSRPAWRQMGHCGSSSGSPGSNQEPNESGAGPRQAGCKLTSCESGICSN